MNKHRNKISTGLSFREVKSMLWFGRNPIMKELYLKGYRTPVNPELEGDMS